MPKIERLEWIAPLTEGRGVTLTSDPAADLFLAQDPNALLLGVLYDSQYATRQAFAIPLKLRDRLGHLDMAALAGAEPSMLMEVFSRKPALHRFPNRCAVLTQQFATVIVTTYGGDSSRLWRESANADELATRVRALPAFGPEKTTWTVGMLGTLGILPFEGWRGYQAKAEKATKKKTT